MSDSRNGAHSDSAGDYVSALRDVREPVHLVRGWQRLQASLPAYGLKHLAMVLLMDDVDAARRYLLVRGRRRDEEPA